MRIFKTKGVKRFTRREQSVLYGFAKNDRDNINDDELQTLRTIGANWLAASAAVVRQALSDGDLQEIGHDDDQT